MGLRAQRKKLIQSNLGQIPSKRQRRAKRLERRYERYTDTMKQRGAR